MTTPLHRAGLGLWFCGGLLLLVVVAVAIAALGEGISSWPQELTLLGVLLFVAGFVVVPLNLKRPFPVIFVRTVGGTLCLEGSVLLFHALVAGLYRGPYQSTPGEWLKFLVAGSALLVAGLWMSRHPTRFLPRATTAGHEGP